MAKKNEEIKYKVVETIAVLAAKDYHRVNFTTKKAEPVIETKELRKVIWGDSEEVKMDLRVWYNVNGVETCGKGISFSQDEWDTFQFALATMDATAEATA